MLDFSAPAVIQSSTDPYRLDGSSFRTSSHTGNQHARRGSSPVSSAIAMNPDLGRSAQDHRLSMSSSSRSSSSSLPLGGPDRRAVQFRKEHELKFAHLHINEDVREAAERLRREEELLEQERRQGKERRKLWEEGGQFGSRRASASGSVGGVPRPLSLAPSKRNSFVHEEETPALRPLSLASAATSSSKRYSLSSSVRAKQPRSVSENPQVAALNRLEVLREGTATPPFHLDSSSSSPQKVVDASFVPSTYSWASSFSGETAELRTAAQYVHSSAAELQPEDGGEEVLVSTPDKQNHRRKKIVAIAHTVRQLEGVGSREAEDPTLYDTIEKAWYGDKGAARQAAPPNLAARRRDSALTAAPPQGLFGNAAALQYGRLPPPTPEQLQLPEPSPDAAQHHGYGFYDYAPGAAYDYTQGLSPPPALSASSSAFPSANPYHFSPPDASLHTPAFASTSFPSASQEAYPAVPYYDYTEEPSRHAEPKESVSLRGSSRYSYASTLHDLALDGAVRHGAELMSGKAWMKPSQGASSTRSAGWDAFHTAPPAFFGPSEYRPPSILSSNVSPELDGRRTPERPLRKYKGHIARLNHTDEEAEVVKAATSGAADGGWGLGFVSNWFAKPADIERSDETEEVDPARQGFHQGEEVIRADQSVTTKGTKPYGAEPGVDTATEADTDAEAPVMAESVLADDEVGVAITTSEEAYPIALEVTYKPSGLQVHVADPATPQGIYFPATAPPSSTSTTTPQRAPMVRSSFSSSSMAAPRAAPIPTSSPHHAEIPLEEYLLYQEMTAAPNVASGSRSSNPCPPPSFSTHSTTSYHRRNQSVPYRNQPKPVWDPTPATERTAAAASYPISAIGSSRSDGPLHPLPIRTSSLKRKSRNHMTERASMPRFPLTHPGEEEEVLAPIRTSLDLAASPASPTTSPSPAIAESFTLPGSSPDSRLRRPLRRHRRSSSSPPSSCVGSSSPRWWSMPQQPAPKAPAASIYPDDTRHQPSRRGRLAASLPPTSGPAPFGTPVRPLPPTAPHAGSPAGHPARPVAHAPHPVQSSGTSEVQTTSAEKTPSASEVMISTIGSTRKTSRTLFYLGFLMPFIWIFAGWIPALVPVQSVSHLEEAKTGGGDCPEATATTTAVPKSTLELMLYHPDKYVRRSRIAAAAVIPLLFVLAIIAIIVLAILR